jgi:hypothetical protein
LGCGKTSPKVEQPGKLVFSAMRLPARTSSGAQAIKASSQSDLHTTSFRESNRGIQMLKINAASPSNTSLLRSLLGFEAEGFSAVIGRPLCRGDKEGETGLLSSSADVSKSGGQAWIYELSLLVT